MRIDIIRKTKSPYGYDGMLFVNGEYVCDTTENPAYHLPEGEYAVTISKMKRWGRRMPTVRAADGTDVGVIAFGNGLLGIKDCRINVGKLQCSGLVINSFNTFKALYDRINNSLRRGNEIILTIDD